VGGPASRQHQHRTDACRRCRPGDQHIPKRSPLRSPAPVAAVRWPLLGGRRNLGRRSLRAEPRVPPSVIFRNAAHLSDRTYCPDCCTNHQESAIAISNAARFPASISGRQHGSRGARHGQATATGSSPVTCGALPRPRTAALTSATSRCSPASRSRCSARWSPAGGTASSRPLSTASSASRPGSARPGKERVMLSAWARHRIRR
jgi:hypothetical protein